MGCPYRDHCLNKQCSEKMKENNTELGVFTYNRLFKHIPYQEFMDTVDNWVNKYIDAPKKHVCGFCSVTLSHCDDCEAEKICRIVYHQFPVQKESALIILEWLHAYGLKYYPNYKLEKGVEFNTSNNLAEWENTMQDIEKEIKNAGVA